MENEIWKDIPGYEGIYQASSIGRIKSVRYGVEKILTQGLNSKYLRVSLSSGGVKKEKNVHVLIAMAFLGHIPSGRDIVVDHKDNDKLNNHISNLQIITFRENSSKDIPIGASRYIGVTICSCKKPFKATISINNHRIYIGQFLEELDAAKAYLKVVDIINTKGEESAIEWIKQNKRNGKTNKCAGVYFAQERNKWRALVTREKKNHFIGYFSSEEEAIKARIEYVSKNKLRKFI